MQLRMVLAALAQTSFGAVSLMAYLYHMKKIDSYWHSLKPQLLTKSYICFPELW